MGKIQLLDCTLRDGGYVNDWQFGYEGIKNVINKLEQSNADVIEIGFIRDEEYQSHRAIYNSNKQMADVIGKKSENTIYAALIEMANYFPPEKLEYRDENGPEAIRYSFWKRKLDDAYEYAKKIKEKGYKLCVQPTRVEQYSDEDFRDMILMFSQLEPYALYIVDTFGLLKKKDLIRYAKIADKYLPKNVVLGYHAHNNMQQAFSNATAFCELNLDRTIMLDGSVFGMGRGAGNLNMEMIMTYLNDEYGNNYNVDYIYKTWDENIKDEYDKEKWGYTLPYFIAASMELNPNYALYYQRIKDMDINEMYNIFKSITGENKYLYSDEKAEKYLIDYRK